MTSRTHPMFFIYAPRATLLPNACTLTLPHHPPRSTLHPPTPNPHRPIDADLAPKHPCLLLPRRCT